MLLMPTSFAVEAKGSPQKTLQCLYTGLDSECGLDRLTSGGTSEKPRPEDPKRPTKGLEKCISLKLRIQAVVWKKGAPQPGGSLLRRQRRPITSAAVRRVCGDVFSKRQARRVETAKPEHSSQSPKRWKNPPKLSRKIPPSPSPRLRRNMASVLGPHLGGLRKLTNGWVSVRSPPD